MPTSITANASRSKHAALANLLREQIVRGDLLPGDRLPSFSQFRTQYGAAISTVEKVLHTLEQDGLIERQHGRGIFVTRRRNLTGNIGFIGSAAFKAQRAPFYIHIANGVQQAARRHDRHIMLLGTDRDWDANSFSAIDGLILCGHRDETNQKIMRAAPMGVPCVSMFTTSKGMSNVTSDDYGGAKLAVRQLLQRGHRRIACLMEQEDSSLASGRFAGYCDALRAAGIEAEPSWMRLSNIRSPQKSSYQEWGRRQMQLWLREGWKESGCTALLAQNEQSAIGAMQALQQEGFRIPAEVSIVGFDGTELCDYASPTLASVQLPLEKIGRKAVEVLIAQIDHGPAEPQSIVVPVSWRNGDSVAAPG